MINNKGSANDRWSLTTEEFFYFFLGLRKAAIREEVRMLQETFPDDSPQKLARRLVADQMPLSLLGSALLQVPLVIPALGPALMVLGVATGASVMIRMNMTLVLQIALVHGRDIDSRARLKEVGAIVAASGLASGTSLLTQLLNLVPSYRAILGGASVLTVHQMIAEAAVRYYGRDSRADSSLPQHPA